MMIDDAETIRNIRAKLIGAWRLVEWSEHRADGQIDYPLGDDAIGQIIYSADGHVSAQLSRAAGSRTRRSFASEDWRDASQSEGATAFKEYFGYFGTFSVSSDAVTHHVAGAWFPNLEGGDQIRYFRFENDHRRLILDADTCWGRVRIIWERCDAADRRDQTTVAGRAKG